MINFKVVALPVGLPAENKPPRYQIQYNTGYVTPCSEVTYQLYEAYQTQLKLNQEALLALTELKKSKESSDKPLTP